MGQTATGKTDIAVATARRFPVEIVSVDSAMVYRGMDIGTAKPPPAVLAGAPHRLIDIRDPEEGYSAGQFRRDALDAIREILAAGRVPMLVGGTMLYFRALRRGLSPLPAADPTLRAEIDAEAGAAGWPALHRRLASVDPAAAARIQPTDAQRIQRALEVYRASGRPLSDWHRDASESQPPWRYRSLALVVGDREVLRERIRRRLGAMMEDGFLEEVRGLLGRTGLDASSPSMRAVGYRQLCRHVCGEVDLAAAIAQAEVATRRLAKRQHTWIRGERDIECLDPLEAGAAGRIYDVVQEIVGAARR